MTTPDERRRNLIWGRDVLEELSRDAGLQAKWRGEAAELLGLYRSTDFLSRCDAGDPVQLKAFADVLTRARSLLEGVRAGQTCSAQRRQHLLVLLRHFYSPEPGYSRLGNWWRWMRSSSFLTKASNVVPQAWVQSASSNTSTRRRPASQRLTTSWPICIRAASSD